MRAVEVFLGGNLRLGGGWAVSGVARGGGADGVAFIQGDRIWDKYQIADSGFAGFAIDAEELSLADIGGQEGGDGLHRQIACGEEGLGGGGCADDVVGAHDGGFFGGIDGDDHADFLVEEKVVIAVGDKGGFVGMGASAQEDEQGGKAESGFFKHDSKRQTQGGFFAKQKKLFAGGFILNNRRIMDESQRIVITGLGLTAPNGNTLEEYRANLVACRPRVQRIQTRYMGEVPAGVCDYDPLKYQKRKEIRNGTRAGSIGIYCAHEAVLSSGLDWEGLDKSRVGVYVGITEHGNVETEQEIYNISKFNYDTRVWTHHHNPRTVANNPAGEITINMGISGPHYTIGAACAAGNAGIIQAVQMLRLGEVDVAIAGGVSESIHTFGIFAAFRSQGALASHADPNKASRPFDSARNGIVVSEGGCLYILERLDQARRRGANIVAEVLGYSINSDATDAVLPNPQRQAQCMRQAIGRAGLKPEEIQLVSTHATATPMGDVQECKALREVFADCPNTYFNNTKSYIGHAMGAAGALELAGNLPSFGDGVIHPTINIEQIDPRCELNNLVVNEPKRGVKVDAILNTSFGMLGINSALVVGRPKD